jgi:hypothetical protein
MKDTFDPDVDNVADRKVDKFLQHYQVRTEFQLRMNGQSKKKLEKE